MSQGALDGLSGRRDRQPWLVSGAILLALAAFLVLGFEFGLSDVRQRIAGSEPWLLLAALAAHYLSLLLRGLRWRLMLLAAAPDPGLRLPSWGACSVYLLLCWFVNAFTWLRLGNVYRAYLAARAADTSIAWVLGTVLGERLLDLAAILAMLALAAGLLLGEGFGADLWPFLLTAAAATLLLGGLLRLLRDQGGRLTRLLPSSWAGAFDELRSSVLPRYSRLDVLVLALLTLAGWLLEAARLWLVILALDLSISAELLLFLTFAQALLLSVPLTPGGLGVVEPGLTGLLLFAFERSDAASIALLDRSISYLSVLAIGGFVFLLRELLGWRRRQWASAGAKTEAALVAEGSSASTRGYGGSGG